MAIFGYEWPILFAALNLIQCKITLKHLILTIFLILRKILIKYGQRIYGVLFVPTFQY